ncbi:hypothetical protein, partial [Paracnuella aquatica]|uniref:hypothetical protein n=1 Tax=Paracnuella aquatica TaxID=2268757 RepID=UPI0019D47840
FEGSIVLAPGFLCIFVLHCYLLIYASQLSRKIRPSQSCCMAAGSGQNLSNVILYALEHLELSGRFSICPWTLSMYTSMDGTEMFTC